MMVNTLLDNIFASTGGKIQLENFLVEKYKRIYSSGLISVYDSIDRNNKNRVLWKEKNGKIFGA